MEDAIVALATSLKITSSLGVLALFTIGALGLLKPTFVASLAGVRADRPAGVMELRAVFGGLMLGMVAALVYIGSPIVYLTVGLAWTGAAIAKVISFFLDRPPLKDSLQGIISDLVCAGLLLSGYFVT
jgi:hypothetical protein